MFLAVAAMVVSLFALQSATAQVPAGGGDLGPSAYDQDLMNVTVNQDAVALEIVEHWRETMDAFEWARGWDRELTAALRSASPEKVLSASKAETYDEVTAALFGRWAGPSFVALDSGVSPPNVLGSINDDLVFTPLTPCRIIDTRFATGGLAGRIGPDLGKQFQVNLASFTTQGGVSTGCGIPTTLEVSAVAISVTSTDQTGPGNVRVIQTGGGVPTASLLNYTAGVNLANAAVVRSATAAGDDIFIYSGVSSTHVVVDLMGFFAAPVATLPETVVVRTEETCNNGASCTVTSDCPGTHRLTGGGANVLAFTNGFDIIWDGPPELSRPEQSTVALPGR